MHLKRYIVTLYDMEEGSMKVREIGIQIFRECEECSYLSRKAFAKDLLQKILKAH